MVKVYQLIKASSPTTTTPTSHRYQIPLSAVQRSVHHRLPFSTTGYEQTHPNASYTHKMRRVIRRATAVRNERKVGF